MCLQNKLCFMCIVFPMYLVSPIGLGRLGGVVASHCFLRRGFRVPSPPDASRPVTKLQIGTASAGDTYSLTRRTNPPTASIVPWNGVALG